MPWIIVNLIVIVVGAIILIVHHTDRDDHAKNDYFGGLCASSSMPSCWTCERNRKKKRLGAIRALRYEVRDLNEMRTKVRTMICEELGLVLKNQEGRRSTSELLELLLADYKVCQEACRDAAMDGYRANTKALEFYADRKNYLEEHNELGGTFLSSVHKDEGDKARKALGIE